MSKDAWLEIKRHQISLYKKQAAVHKRKRAALLFGCVATGICCLIPVAILLWKLSTHENRAAQLLQQLADAITQAINQNATLEKLRENTVIIETRFLSNDDELFVKKSIWTHFMDWKRRKRDEEIRYERALAEYNRTMFGMKPMKDFIMVDTVNVGPVWNTDIPHRQGYKDSNTIEDEWAIIKAFRRLIWASSTETHAILDATSKLAQENPVVFERYLRKKKISKKMKHFKWRARVHYLSAAAKMRLVTFVEGVLALEPHDLNEATITLMHEKNEQIQKYTTEFWQVHRRSLKFYWFEALWLLLLVPFIIGAGDMIGRGAYIEGVLVFTVGAALVAFGEMALVVRQKIKLNGKKLIPPLIASLIGSRHSMSADTDCAEGIDAYRRRFKNLEKHFIMTTPEIDSVKYVKDNLRDEDRNSKLHEADAVCADAQRRMDTYYRMFHLYRRKCLQYGALELFMAIMLVPMWGISFLLFLDLAIPLMFTVMVLAFEGVAAWRHLRVWRFKEMYFKIYQGLSVLMVDGDLRQEPERLNEMFAEIERSALAAIASDPAMALMVGTLKRTSGQDVPKDRKRHPLDKKMDRIRQARQAENERNGNWHWR